MFESERRKFLTQTGLGLTGIAGLILRAGAQPTPAIVNTEENNRILIQMAPSPKVEITAKGKRVCCNETVNRVGIARRARLRRSN